jgi:hypothetical protein
MDNYPISISVDKQIYHFEVGEYLHNDGERCKVKAFQEGKFVASFEVDDHQYLHVCHNPGQLDEQLLHMLADQIEAHHPLGINREIEER